jgi:hypothetical protein
VSALLDKTPKYRAVKIVKLDWDSQRKLPITRELKVARRATLIMFSKGKEVGRVIAQSNPDDIAAMFDKALS